MSTDGHGTKWSRKIDEKSSDRMSRANERYRRKTDGRQQIANVNREREFTFAKNVSKIARFLANVNVLRMCCRPSVYRLSVTFMHPTHPVGTFFVNLSTPFGTMAIRWHPQKILWRSSQGNPSAGGVKHKKGSQIQLFTNRKSYMSFRLVPKSVTLNDLERCNGNGPFSALFHLIP